MEEYRFELRDLPQRKTLEEYAELYPEINVKNIEASLFVLRTVADFSGKLNELFAVYKLSEAKFVVLMLLNREPNKQLTPSQLSDKAGVTRGTMTGLLDGLEKDELVKRIRHDSDRRSIYITITKDGEELLNKILPNHYKLVNDLMMGLNEEDVIKLLSIMKIIKENVAKTEVKKFE